MTEGHQNNLAFIFAITKKFRLKKTNLFKVINNFKGLKYRQQIIYQSKELTLINDSKATSYSSSINILKSLKKVFWIIRKKYKVFFLYQIREKRNMVADNRELQLRGIGPYFVCGCSVLLSIFCVCCFAVSFGRNYFTKKKGGNFF